ncbi:MAG: DUF4380 domain-containing protein [Allomuricauda sp.]
MNSTRYFLCFLLIGFFYWGQAQVKISKLEANQFKLKVSDLEMEIDANSGAKITSFKIGGHETIAGKEIHPFFYGSTLWLAPEGKWKGHGSLDRGIYVEQSKSSDVLSLVSEADAERGFQFTKKFMANQDTSITIKYSIKNIAEVSQGVAAWEVTRVPTGGLAFMPKRDETDLPRPNNVYPLPNTQDKIGMIWYPHDSDTSSPQKLFMEGGAGWMAYVKEGILFAKSFPIVDRDEFAPGESNIELYVNKEKTYVELENQGPYENLQRGESLTYEVKWYVRELPSHIKVEVGNPDLRKYVEKMLKITTADKEKKLEEATALLVQAMLKPEADVLDGLFSDELSYGHSGGLIENKEQIIRGLTQGPFHFGTIDIKDQTAYIVGNVGIVRHFLTTNYSDNGKTGTLNFGILLVWQIENGNWKLLARQAAKL